MKPLPILSLIFFVAACNTQVQPINFGSDQCARCRMTISDKRYGAELLTKKGKVYKYDAAECLVNALVNDKVVREDDVHSVWVINYNNPGTLMNADKSVYLQSRSLPSPMGMFITPIPDLPQAQELQQKHAGSIFTWEEVCEMMRLQIQPL